MKSKFLKATVLATAALAIGALASPTMARTLTYTFGTVSGGSYCDGITLSNGSTGSTYLWSGNHTGSCTGGDGAGGFSSRISGAGKYINAVLTDNVNAPGLAFTFLLQPSSMTWFLFANAGSGYQLYNEGVLIPGAPPVKAGAKPSTFKNPAAKDMPIH